MSLSSAWALGKSLFLEIKHGVVIHTCNPSIHEAGAGGSPQGQDLPGLHKQVQGQRELRSETLPQTNK